MNPSIARHFAGVPLVAQAEIDQSYARVATQNFNQNTGAMDAYLKRIGSFH